jgi:hypothetical protein
MPRCHADGQVSSALRPRFPSSRGVPRRFDGPIVIHPPPPASHERPDVKTNTRTSTLVFSPKSLPPFLGLPLPA